MGLHVADSDSESLNEKGQETTAHRQSHCPLVLLRQIFREYRERREQQYRPRIDKIRGQINKSREDVKLSRSKGAWHGTTSTEQRHALWEGGLGSSSLKYLGYGTSCSYKFTTSSVKTGWKEVVVQDFHTPEGREEAFKWLDAKHQRYERNAAYVLHKYDVWEENFQSYVKQHHSDQREILLLGGDKVDWLNVKVEELPN